MLLELSLRNYTIIEKLDITFNKGLNIITGETGTGKSIIVGALALLLGGRVNSELIKSGADESSVTAIFDISKRSDILSKLEEYGIPRQPDSSMVARRVFSKGGRNRVYVNDTSVTLRVLSNITSALIDVFSQHEHQSLLSHKNHLRYLDSFMSDDTLINKYKAAYKKYKILGKELRELKNKASEQYQQQDYIRYQLEELRSLGISENEDLLLEREEKILSNFQRISDTLTSAQKLLYEDEGSVYERLNVVSKDISSIASLDSSLADISNTLDQVSITIDDLTHSIREYLKGINYDPTRLDEIRTRLDVINKIKRKYNTDLSGLAQKISELEKMLAEFDNIENELSATEKEHAELYKLCMELTSLLSAKRKKVARELERKFQEEAASVGLKDSVIEVLFEKKELSEDGTDSVEFLFSATRGEPPKPISAVASGGELSRVMLVFKSLINFSEKKKSVLVFDEIDSGIGGKVAETVGKRIKKLAQNSQVLCITHLPQIAKFADTHYLVTKIMDGKSTKVNITALDCEERVKELGRMLAGGSVTAKTLAAAREMLRNY